MLQSCRESSGSLYTRTTFPARNVSLEMETMNYSVEFATYSGHTESHLVLGAAFTRIPRRRTGGGERCCVSGNASRPSLNPRSLHGDWLRQMPSSLLIG